MAFIMFGNLNGSLSEASPVGVRNPVSVLVEFSPAIDKKADQI